MKIKMGETTSASNPSLQVSVSFGRFENDSLSWEKWSAFSPNRYLEEVEKCATPGSVAQKKAYFEAHYKRIAARKAELLAQEKQTEKDEDPSRSEDHNVEDLSGNTGQADSELALSNSQADSELALSNSQRFSERFMEESNSIGEMGRIHLDNSEEDIEVSVEWKCSLFEGENREMDGRSDILQKNKTEEAVCCIDKESPIEAEDVKEVPQDVDNKKVKASEVEVKDVKLDHPKESKKVSSLNRESNAAKTKKMPAPSTSKVSLISMPKGSKPTSTPSKTLASASSTRKGSSPTLSTRKNISIEESKRVSDKSLHMSLSLGPKDPDPVPHTTMRKSFIMEKMGDKDIIKRAFKTFQNNLLQPKTSGEDRSTVKKQVPSRGTETRVSTSMALRKENGRPTKIDSMDKRSGNAVRAIIGAEKGKEFPKKTEEKSNAKEAARTRLQSKSMREKEADIKKPNQNFKATPLPAFYRSQQLSKSQPRKGDVNTKSSMTT